MEANRHENRDFWVEFENERWHIDGAWVDVDGKVAWYDGKIIRDDTIFYRIFSPGQKIERWEEPDDSHLAVDR